MFTQSLYRNGLQSARYMYPLIVTVQSLVCEVCVPTYCTGTISSIRGMCTYLLYRYNLLCVRYVYLLIVPAQSLVYEVCVPTYCTGTISCVQGMCTYLLIVPAQPLLYEVYMYPLIKSLLSEIGVCLHTHTTAVSYILSHNLSPKVVFLFKSFLVITIYHFVTQ